jgi:hypothetical protein
VRWIRRKTTMTNELATRSNGAGAATVAPPAGIDKEAVLRYLKLDARDPAVQALIVSCQRYGLDPILKHAVIIGGNLYVTRDGLLHVAHSSGDFDGLEVEQMGDTGSHFVAVAIVYRKSMRHPFKFQGRYPKSGQMAKYGPEMAEKVAVCRALRHAFDVSLCSREETWEEEPLPLMEQEPAATLPALPQRAAYPAPPAAEPRTNPLPGLRTQFRSVAEGYGFQHQDDAGVSRHVLDLCHKKRGGIPVAQDYQTAIDRLHAEYGQAAGNRGGRQLRAAGWRP